MGLEMQTRHRLAIGRDDPGADGPTATALGYLKHEFVGPLLELDWGHILVHDKASINVVAVHHLAIQPSLHAVIAAQQQGSVAVLRRGDRVLR